MGNEGSRTHPKDDAAGGSTDWFERELAQLNAQLDAIAAWVKTRPAKPVPLPPWRPSVHAASAADENAGGANAIGRGLAAAATPAADSAPASGGRPDDRPSTSVPPQGGGEGPGQAPSAAGSAQASGGGPDRPPGPAAPPASGGDRSAIVPSTAAAPAEPPRPTGTDLSDPKNFGLMPPVAELEQGRASAEDYRQRLSRHLAFATTVLHTSKVPAAVWREWRVFEKSIHDRLLALSAPPPTMDPEI